MRTLFILGGIQKQLFVLVQQYHDTIGIKYFFVIMTMHDCSPPPPPQTRPL